MTDTAKITLSDKELSLVQNTDWILTKHRIIQNVFELFSFHAEQIKLIMQDLPGLGDELKTSIPKIAKGEQYRQLPYVIMDYPKLFGKEDIFALRTMFWWGNFFSITLHLAGTYKACVNVEKLFNNTLLKEQLFICVNDNQWQHHFDESNYLPLSKFTIQQIELMKREKHFLKLSLKYNLEKWNKMPALLNAGTVQLFQLID